MTDKLEFNDLKSVLEHFSTKGNCVEGLLATYRSQVTELTGHDLSKPVTALDVVKIVQRVFFGGEHAAGDPKRSDSDIGGCDVVYQPGGAPPATPAVDASGAVDNG